MRSPLFAALFDYAGVFPPAALPVDEARTEYLATLGGEHGWVLGPMLVLASQLDALGPVPQLGIVADAAVGDGAPALTQAETRAAAGDAAARIRDLTTVAPVVYVEAAEPGDLAVLEPIATARAVGLDVRAKIRTGGATASAFPSPTRVTAFLHACVERGLPFKATAGLHHPVRTDSDVAGATEHGFVNMLAATRCALAGDDEATLGALSSTELAEFDLATATWRGVGAGVDVEELRASFRSIGSCSVAEPTGYLRDLGVL